MDPITSTVVSGVIGLVTKLFGLDTTSDDAKIKLATIQLEAEKLLAAQVSGQLEVNKIEAASSSLFVAGWRPYIGWVCGSALTYAYCLKPFIDYFCTLKGLPVLPNLDISTMMPVLLGMLGLGAMRSYEKVQTLKTGKIVNGVWSQ